MAHTRSTLKAAATAALICLAAGSARAQDVCRIAVLGDSIAAGLGLDPADALPAVLERELQAAGYACTVIDAGVSGDTTAGGLARLDWMLGDRPTHVVVELGGNDVLRAIPPEATEANLSAIVERLRAEHIEVLLAGMLAPPNLGPDYADAFAAMFPRIADRYGVALYPFVLDGVAAERELNQPDGIHPNATGVALIVERMLPTVRAWLDATGAKPPPS